MGHAGAEGAFGEDKEAKAEFEELARAEMDVWKSMVSGKAIQEHMEDVYHNMIKVCSCPPCILLHMGSTLYVYGMQGTQRGLHPFSQDRKHLRRCHRPVAVPIGAECVVHARTLHFVVCNAGLQGQSERGQALHKESRAVALAHFEKCNLRVALEQ